MANKIKMDHQIVAHYCKKLEKAGFIICTILQQNSERKVYLREAYYQKYLGIIYEFYPSLTYLDKLPYKKLFMNDEPHQVIENLSSMLVYPLSGNTEEDRQGNNEAEDKEENTEPVQ